MKKKIIILAALVLGLTSCSLDINTDPNYPATVTPKLLLPSAQNFIAWTVGNGMYNHAGFFAQYYDQMPESNQYNALTEYDFTESDQIMDKPYSQLYAGALMDLSKVLEGEISPADRYAVSILRAFSFQLLVDNMDFTPYLEALQGNANATPKWDSGQSVYEGVLNEMSEAEANLDAKPMTCTDILLDKNIAQWNGFANALRLRMYLRFIDAGVDVAGYTTKTKALVDAGGFFTGDVKFDAYTDEASKRNPWYSNNKVNLATNHVASYPIVEYLNATNDPRMAYNFVKATGSGNYAGELPGSKKILDKKKNKDYSFLQYYATKPVYFFTQSELQFLLAEVYLRFYSDDAKAKAAYEAAISADFAVRGMAEQASAMYSGDGTVAWTKASNDAAKLELIYMQKWVALCYMDHMEAWSEIRRTDCPKLSSRTAEAINADPSIYTPGELISPMRNGMGAGAMVKRMFFPKSARQLNANTPAAVPATTSVWWDKK